MDALRADAVGHLAARPADAGRTALLDRPDTARKRSRLGGESGVSPVLDRLAREGLIFRRHRSLAPNTLPSTKSLFVGRVYRTRGGWTLAPDEGRTRQGSPRLKAIL